MAGLNVFQSHLQEPARTQPIDIASKFLEFLPSVIANIIAGYSQFQSWIIVGPVSANCYSQDFYCDGVYWFLNLETLKWQSSPTSQRHVSGLTTANSVVVGCSARGLLRFDLPTGNMLSTAVIDAEEMMLAVVQDEEKLQILDFASCHAFEVDNTLSHVGVPRDWIMFPSRINARAATSYNGLIFIYRGGTNLVILTLDKHNQKYLTSTRLLSWTGQDMPFHKDSIEGFGSARIGHEWFIFGGRESPDLAARRTVFKISLVSFKITTVAHMEFCRFNPSVVVANELIYILGGTLRLRQEAHIECYDPSTNIWRTLGVRAPVPVQCAAAF